MKRLIIISALTILITATLVAQVKIGTTNYSDLKSAFDAINAGTHTGDVVVKIEGNTTETANPTLLANSNVTSVAIYPTVSNLTVNLQGNELTIDNTNYPVTIDGRVNQTGTTRDLTVQGSSLNLIAIKKNADNITVRYITAKFTVSGRDAGILIDASASGTASDNIAISNCVIGDATNPSESAVRVFGDGTNNVYASVINIRNNTLYGMAGSYGVLAFRYVGKSSTTSEISGNTIELVSATATFNFSIDIVQYNGKLNIFKNKVTTAQVSSGSIRLIGLSNAGAGAEANIYNNFFGGNLQHSGTPDQVYVIHLSSSGVVNIYYNTIVINSLTNPPSTESACVYINSGTVTAKNNIMINEINATNSYCIYRYSGSLTSDYNDLYPAGASGNVGHDGTNPQKTLSDWQTATGQDANSVSKSVQFVSSTDLHLSGSSVGDVDLAGTPITGITDDIDGDARNSTYPYMGADERTDAPLPAKVSSLFAFVENGVVKIEIETATEDDDFLGLNIYRKEEGKDYILVSSYLDNDNLKAKGSGAFGSRYVYYDYDVSSGGKYYYRVRGVGRSGVVFELEVSVYVDVPERSVLYQNYPNPFNSSTVIRFALAEGGYVDIDLYDVAGRFVKKIYKGRVGAGYHSVVLNGDDLSGGVYYYRLKVNDLIFVKKMVLLK